MEMLISQEAYLSWVITKALLIIVSGLVAVLYLAWAGAKKLFPK
jgi:hypothetical protein